MADEYESWSPYNYTLGNPINYIDPDGRWVKGAGFWNNLTKSDERIHAERQAAEANQQDENYTYSVGKENGEIGIHYEANYWTNHGDYSSKHISFTPVGDDGQLGKTTGSTIFRSNAPASGAVTPSYPIENLLIGGAIAKPITFLGGRLLSGIGGRFTAKTSSRAFFSGAGTEARAIGEGFQTLGQTRAGQNLMKLTKGMDYYPGSKAYNMWARLSSTYAKGIPKGSKVNVFLNNPSPTGIWNAVEKPLLQQRGIKIIYR